MTDAERARMHIVAKNRSRTDYEKINDLESEFASVRSEATAAAEQRIAALEAKVERLTRERDDWRAQWQATFDARCSAAARDAERAEAAERERDEARAALEATEDETALANTDAAYERNRADAAEAQLARARTDALEEAAKLLDVRAATCRRHSEDEKRTDIQRDAWADCANENADAARAIRALANTDAAYERNRAEAAEKERDELRAELDAEGREWLRTKDIDRLQAAEARLARAREALEHTRETADLVCAGLPEGSDVRAMLELERVHLDAALRALDSEPAGRSAPDYEAAARFLFDLLDDIDTAEDRAKADDATFRKIAHRLHRRRFEVAETDGYELTFKPAGRAARAAEGDGTP